MAMEQHVWGSCKQNLTITATEPPNRRRRPCLQALTSARALIVNPSTSEETASHVLETIARYLRPDQDPILLDHVLKLLSDIAVHRRHLSRAVIDTIHAHVLVRKDATRLTAEALSVLVTIAEQDGSSPSTMVELGEDLVLSICFSPSVTVRSWLLLNVDKFHIRPRLLVTLLLGFMKDPYPFVRRAALGGLIGLSKSANSEWRGLIEECYNRAVELLLDTDECVRSAAVRVVGEWGQTLVASDHEVDNRDWFDVVFVQLCSMVRDMSVEVRIEAFVALGKIRLVSEDILLQTLSKKVLGIIKEKKIVGQCSAKKIELPASNAAGAFVHGLEDEFYEVRRSACNSLGMLTVFSIQFAGGALNLLIDVLNDDSTVVRLQTLETMYYMVTSDRLRVQEMHMHMFLSTLMDTSSLIRHAARKVFRLMKLPVLEMFASLIVGLLTNLETYPEDEADILSVLFNAGRNHGSFVVSFLKEVAREMEPSCEGDLGFDSVRITALLVLAISAPLSHEQRVWNIPPRIFSYALPLLGRISRALNDAVDQDTLLAYLSHCSRSILFPATELNFREDEFVLPVVEVGIPNYNNDERPNSVGMPLRQISNGSSEIQFIWNPGHVGTPFDDYRQKLTFTEEEATFAVKPILTTVAETWPLIQSGCTYEVVKTLRGCNEELSKITMDSLGSVGVLAFTSHYLQVIQLVTKVWEHFLPPKNLRFYGMERLDLLLEKLDTSLKELRYRFLGMSKEEELHVLELILLTCVLRLSKVESCCQQAALKRLCATISTVELICREGSIEPSDFVKELKKSFCQVGACNDESSYNPFVFKRLLELFSLKQIVSSGKIKHIRAELDVPGNDSENPLSFISGLPVGITFQISLYNVLKEDRLWLKMAVGELIQYVFLDLNQFGGCDDVRTVTFTVPLYRTPKAVAFSLRACIGRECFFDDVHLVKGRAGPKRELTFLCKEEEVYLVNGCY